MYFVLKLSKLCNLRCTYCYEYEELGVRDRMPLAAMEHFFAGLAARQPPGGWPRLDFVLHGGEPMLLPAEYLEQFVELQRQHLGGAGIRYRTSLQTNLTRLDAEAIARLERLQIGLGVSLDVFGDQRVTLAGRSSQDKVLRNIQLLFDTRAIERLGVGIISVLHRANVDRVVGTFEFCAHLRLNYRILPIFSIADPPARMRHLMLEHDQVVDALQAVARRWLTSDEPIDVYPLRHYLDAAVYQLLGREANRYDPSIDEWAVIVNTNGDAYTHADAYTQDGYIGNLFVEPLLDVLQSELHRRTIELRLARSATCHRCQFGHGCSRLPVIEALPSERAYDAAGAPRCPIAEPMIRFMVQEIQSNRAALSLLKDTHPTVDAGALPTV
jgi:uncharacterized protein